MKHRITHELGLRILQKTGSLWDESNRPIFWLRIAEELGIERSKAHRIISKLIHEKKLKRIDLKRDFKTNYYLLEPKNINIQNNQFEFRGRTKLYLIPSDAEWSPEAQQWCGQCLFFTRTHQCELISKLLAIGKPESIRDIRLREVLRGHENEVLNPRIHRHMRACDQFEKKIKDLELKSLKTETYYYATDKGVRVKVLSYVCHQCGALMPQSSDVRTFKCPKCFSKYTRRLRQDGTEVIKVNVDVHSLKKEKIRQITGIGEHESEQLEYRQKQSLTKRINTQKKKTRFLPEKKTSLNTQLRKYYKQKYGTAAFYKPRIIANLLSAILATRELNIFGIVEEAIVDGHIYIQIEQLLQSAEKPTLGQFQTAERVIAKQYFQVYGKLMEHYGFKISRDLMRHVNESMEFAYRGSKAYSFGDCLVNNCHTARYEHIRQLCYNHGFGWDCPGFAEHTHPRFGLVLDLSDPVKYADRFTLLQAIINGQLPEQVYGREISRIIDLQLTEHLKEKITHDDSYSAVGRQDQEVFFVKRNSFKKLIRLRKFTDQKMIYPIGKDGDLFESISLGKTFEQFIQHLAQSLLNEEKLTTPYIYIPVKEDYIDICDLISEFNMGLIQLF